MTYLAKLPFPPSIIQQVESVPNLFKHEKKFLANHLKTKGKLDKEELSYILDWARAEKDPLRCSYQEALQKSTSWHKQFVIKTGSYTTKNVVHTFPDGWTIVEINSEEDLKTEGDLMGHCVGSYWDYVKEGKTKIYSLRDPNNNPHATIEYQDTITQIQGKQNTIPLDKYKQYLFSWKEECLIYGIVNWKLDLSPEEIIKIENTLLELGDVRYLYQFACNVPGANKEKIETELLELGYKI